MRVVFDKPASIVISAYIGDSDNQLLGSRRGARSERFGCPCGATVQIGVE